MFGDKDLRLLLACCTTFSITRTSGESELAYSYADFKGAAEAAGFKKELPSALVLFAMLAELGFRRVTISNKACMAAPMLTVAYIAYEAAKEFASKLPKRQKR